MLLGVNIDHIATLRQARYSANSQAHNAEPSILETSRLAQAGGADSLTIHVREDRRHMQDHDAYQIREQIDLPLNLEMANTAEMVKIALDLKPDFVCLVPESRQEVTTEGGLDAQSLYEQVAPNVELLQANNIKVSLFIDPDEAQIIASQRMNASMVELHTGTFANQLGQERENEIQRLKSAAQLGHQLGLQINAGHGINYQNISALFDIPHLVELNIGHSIIARALTTGLKKAVNDMRQLMKQYPG